MRWEQKTNVKHNIGIVAQVIKTRDPAQSVCFTGLKLQEEGGTYGTVEIPDGSGGNRLPKNSRFVNPSATTLNVAPGLRRFISLSG